MATWFQGIPVGVYLMVGLLFVLFTWEIIGAIRRFEWLRETAFHEIAQTRATCKTPLVWPRSGCHETVR